MNKSETAESNPCTFDTASYYASMVNLLTFQLQLLLLLLPMTLLQFPTCSSSSVGRDLCSSSCGDIRNISNPFRLNTDPISCGHKELEITCDDNVPMLYNMSERYYVRSINYNNYTIRLSDASLVPLPNSSTFLCNHSHTAEPYTIGRWGNILTADCDEQNLVIISCPRPFNISTEPWSSYVDGAICSGHESDEHAAARRSKTTTSSYWYAAVAYPVGGVYAEDSCRVELMLVTSMEVNTSKGFVSFDDVRESWSYGFDVSWRDWFCSRDYPREDPCGYKDEDTGFLKQFWDNLQQLWGSSLHRLLVKLGLNYDKKDAMNITIPFLVRAVPYYVFILYVLLHAVFLTIGAPFVIAFLVYKWRRRHLSFYDNIECFLENTYDQLMPVRYSYGDIKKITKGFKSELGQGGYGCVYKGKLRSGQIAAVKILGKADTDGKDFINEVATIGRVHHFNVVRLIGFCAEGSKRALVYPFMPNGSLDKYILSHHKDHTDNVPTITDEKMYEIALGVANGIEYLHQGCEIQILHFDIKPHNILLDENFVPKVADFGLAKLYPTDKSIVSLTAIKGTLGYMAPEFFYRSVGGISYKADVYSFGRMLMEMAARKRDPSSVAANSSEIFLPSWMHDQFSQGNDNWLGDTTEEDKEIRKKMMMVGLWCVQLIPTDRPSMQKVIEMLRGGLNALQLPPRPSFAPSFFPMNVEDSSTEITNASEDSSSYYMTFESAENEDEAVLVESHEYVV